MLLYIMEDWSGDSGAAIYSTGTNHVVGVVSTRVGSGDELKFTGAFAFAFTKAQIDRAQKFVLGVGQ